MTAVLSGTLGSKPTATERNTMYVHKPSYGATPGTVTPVLDPEQLQGREIEIGLDDRIIDAGVVDCLTADGSVLWLKPDALNHRRLIQLSPGLYIWVLASDDMVVV
jgi:hypothetical protein